MIRTETVGTSGRPLVWLPSNGMGAFFYRDLAERMAARGTRHTLVDLPGFAAPPLPERGWAPLLDATEAVIRDAGPDAIVVGHSLGGLVALLLAPRLRIGGLVLIEPAVIPWRWLARVAARIYVRRVFDAGPPRFTNRGPWFWRLHDPATYPADVIARVEATHAGADRAAVAALHAELPERYPLPFEAVRWPTLVVRGASSGPVMAAGQRDLVRRIRGAEAVTIPQAGHWLVHEQDDALLADLDRWIRQLDTPPRADAALAGRRSRT